VRISQRLSPFFVPFSREIFKLSPVPLNRSPAILAAAVWSLGSAKENSNDRLRLALPRPGEPGSGSWASDGSTE
jgi:hypothetical protein